MRAVTSGSKRGACDGARTGCNHHLAAASCLHRHPAAPPPRPARLSNTPPTYHALGHFRGFQRIGGNEIYVTLKVKVVVRFDIRAFPSPPWDRYKANRGQVEASVTSPWAEARPWKTTLHRGWCKFGLQTHSTGWAVFPRNWADAIEPLQMRVCNRIRRKTGSRPMSSWSQLCHLRAFLPMPFFSTWRICFPSLGSFLSCDCPNKECKVLTVQLPSRPDAGCTPAAAYSCPPYPRYYSVSFTIGILRAVNRYYCYSFIFFPMPCRLGMRQRAVYHLGYSHYNYFLLNDLYSCNYNGVFWKPAVKASVNNTNYILRTCTFVSMLYLHHKMLNNLCHWKN